MENYDSNGIEMSDKIDIIITCCHKLADLLKDPTIGGTKELTSDKRTAVREEAYDELLICLDVLAASAQFNNGFFDVINIATKYKLNSLSAINNQ